MDTTLGLNPFTVDLQPQHQLGLITTDPRVAFADNQLKYCIAYADIEPGASVRLVLPPTIPVAQAHCTIAPVDAASQPIEGVLNNFNFINLDTTIIPILAAAPIVRAGQYCWITVTGRAVARVVLGTTIGSTLISGPNGLLAMTTPDAPSIGGRSALSLTDPFDLGAGAAYGLSFINLI